MKQKFKDYGSVNDFKHDQYRKLLKAFLEKQTGTVNDFVLKLDAKFQGKDTMPFVYVGDITQSWKSFKKENKAEKSFVAGRCFIESLGEGFVLKMLPEIGKGAKESTVKAVNKELKKSNIFIEFVSELPEVTTEESVEANSPKTEEGATPLKLIEDGIKKYATLYSQVQKNKEKVEEKNQILKRLKTLCYQWRESTQAGASPSANHAEIEKVVQQFEAFFEKREKAKKGDEGDIEGLKAREEQLYAKVLKYRNDFYKSLSSGSIQDVSIIENRLEDMKEQISEWTKFVKTHKKSDFGDILKQMVADYKEANKTFGAIKENLEKFFDSLEKQDMEQATKFAEKIREVL